MAVPEPIQAEVPTAPSAPPSSGPPPSAAVAPAERPAALSQPLSIARMVRALPHCWFTAFLLAMLAATAAGAALWRVVPVHHTAEALLEITRKPDLTDDTAAARFRATQAQLLQSPAVLGPALKDEEVAHLASRHGGSDRLAWITGQVTVDTSRAGLLVVRVRGTGAEEPVVVLHAVVRAYLREVQERNRAEVERLQSAVARAEKAVHDQTALLAQVDDPRRAALEKDLQTARSELQKARIDLTVLQGRASEIGCLAAPDAALQEALRQDNQGRELLESQARIEAKVRRFKAVSALGDKDPNLPPLLKELRGISEKVSRRREELRPVVEAQVRSQARGELALACAAIQKRIEAQEQLLGSLAGQLERLGGPQSPAQLQALRDEVASARETSRRASDDLQRVQQQQTAGPAVRWQGESETVRAMDIALRTGAATGGAALAFVGGLLLVGWGEASRLRVGSASDVAHGLGVPVIGQVPTVSSRALAARSVPEGRRAAAEYAHWIEAIDALRTVVLRGAAERPRLVLVTSAAAGEGKSTLAAQLAASLSRAWRKTLLIDGDLRHPTLHQRLGAPLEPGLCEALRGENEVEEIIQPTPEGRLSLLSAGHWDDHAGQALAQEGVGELFARLKDQYDVLVVDAPPVLPVADALVLSQYADAIVLAVKCGTSRLPTVHAARQRLGTVAAPLLGAVVIGPDWDLVDPENPYPVRKQR